MRKTSCSLIGLFFFLLMPHSISAQDSPRHKAKYNKQYLDPVMEKMKQKKRKQKKKAKETTDGIRKRQREQKEKKKKEKKWLGSDFAGVAKPASPTVFRKVFFFPPVRQYLTGTCWCFSTTSFFESEIYRLTGQKIKLAEMYTVYHEYLEKAKRFLEERGDSFFQQASEGNAVIRIWRDHGIVPADAYPGVLDENGRHDHVEMVSEMKAYLRMVKQEEMWDENLVVASLGLIMNKYMGKPPRRFVYQGRKMTPKRFLASVLKLSLDDYVSVMSTLSKPFYTFGEYEVEANWWHSKEYYNVPLDQFYQIIKHAIQNGYTVRLNGDISEPGYQGLEDAAIIPSFDIPPGYIDQSAREFRFSHKSTTDDHDIHLVGYTRIKDSDWFLIKDSSRAGHNGKFKGYLFYREDYIKLKMLTYIVHQDAVRAVVKDFKPMARPSKSP